MSKIVIKMQKANKWFLKKHIEIKIFLILFWIFLPSLLAQAHSKHHLKNLKKIKKEGLVPAYIQKAYQKKIEPILKQKCFDCHGPKPKHLPWYYSIWGIQQLMNWDMSEAKEHLDMSKGFPFQGHGTIPEDLKALKEATQKDDMPPWRYLLLHKHSTLTKEEKKILLNWIQETQKNFPPSSKETATH